MSTPLGAGAPAAPGGSATGKLHSEPCLVATTLRLRRPPTTLLFQELLKLPPHLASKHFSRKHDPAAQGGAGRSRSDGFVPCCPPPSLAPCPWHLAPAIVGSRNAPLKLTPLINPCDSTHLINQHTQLALTKAGRSSHPQFR